MLEHKIMIETAIVGLGWWGRKIVELVEGKSDRLRIVRAVEPDVEGSKDIGERYHFPISPAFEDALRDPKVAAVILTTPHSLHEQQVVAAAGAGKHVFCEKPLGLTRASAERSVTACRDAGVVLGIGHERRFEPPMLELRRLATSGALGTLLQIEANFSHDKFVKLPEDNWRRSAKEAPAGGMTATGIHLLDLAVSLLGPAERVLAESRTLASDLAAGDSLATLIRFRSCATASINVMLATPFISRFALFGSKGWVEVRDKAHVEAPEGWTLTRSFAAKGGIPESVDYPVAAPVRDNLEAFANAVSGRAPYPIPMEDMIATTAALEAIFRSSSSGGIEQLA
jgi:predicted dehydrogenase